MTEEAAATPGWVDKRLDAVFAGLPPTPELDAARQDYAECLARGKAPAAPSDLLGAEFEGCAGALRRGLQAAGIDGTICDALLARLEAVEAEIAGES